MSILAPNSDATHTQRPQYYQHIPVQISTIKEYTLRISISVQHLPTIPLLGQIYMLIPIDGTIHTVGIPCILQSHARNTTMLQFLAHKDEITTRSYTIPSLLQVNRCNLWGPLSRPFNTKLLHGTTMWHIAGRDSYLVSLLQHHSNTENLHTPIILQEDVTSSTLHGAINTHRPHALFISNPHMPLLKGITYTHQMEIYSVHALSNIICGLGACRCCVEIFDNTVHPICQRGYIIKRLHA